MPSYLFFFFNDTATTEIYTLSLHDALPIWGRATRRAPARAKARATTGRGSGFSLETNRDPSDRKSTRLNSIHANISYAVFCLKKKKNKKIVVHNVNQMKVVFMRAILL